MPISAKKVENILRGKYTHEDLVRLYLLRNGGVGDPRSFPFWAIPDAGGLTVNVKVPDNKVWIGRQMIVGGIQSLVVFLESRKVTEGSFTVKADYITAGNHSQPLDLSGFDFDEAEEVRIRTLRLCSGLDPTLKVSATLFVEELDVPGSYDKVRE